MRSSIPMSLLAAVLMTAIAVCVAAETINDRPDVVSEYARGKRLMREGDWLEASRVFEQLAGRYPNSPNLDLFVFNRAKAAYYFGSYSEALAGLSSFISRFPKSPHLAHAHFFRGNILYLKGQLGRAVTSYIEAYGLSQDARLSNILVASLTSVIAGAKSVSLGPADFASLPEDRKCELIEFLVEALVAREDYHVARTVAAVCGREADVPHREGTRESLTSRGFELAVVLPFSGELQSFGEEIYEGAVIAAETYRQETGHELTLSMYDTRGDPVSAARIVKELKNSQVDVIVGPLTSEAAAVASAALSCDVLPMIAPAATQAGLTLLSEGTFQLSPNIELQGIRMAEYAVLNRQDDSAAIITSTSVEHLTMSRAFARRFEELGGTIVATEYYRPRDKDFGKYIQDIKAVLLGVHPDSTFFVDERGDTLDADGVPAYVDCLFLPGKASQLRLLLAQINFYNLNAIYLGSDGWDDDAIYRLGDLVTKGAVFTSPFLQQSSSDEYLKFAAAYDRRYGKQPRRLASLGYDAVRIASLAVLAGATTREELIAEIGSINQHRGVAAGVTFGQYRENIEMPIYQIIDGSPVFLGESQAGPTDSEIESD